MPGLGTSICHWWGRKRKRKKKKSSEIPMVNLGSFEPQMSWTSGLAPCSRCCTSLPHNLMLVDWLYCGRWADSSLVQQHFPHQQVRVACFLLIFFFLSSHSVSFREFQSCLFSHLVASKVRKPEMVLHRHPVWTHQSCGEGLLMWRGDKDSVIGKAPWRRQAISNVLKMVCVLAWETGSRDRTSEGAGWSQTWAWEGRGQRCSSDDYNDSYL